MESEIKINFRDKKPVTEQIHAEIRERIEQGSIAPGERLPTVRWLAGQLKVNFNTVARAYRLLDQEGLITTRQGRGTFVVDTGERSKGAMEAEGNEDSSPAPGEGTITPRSVTLVARTIDDTRTGNLERVAALVREETERAGLSLDELLAFLNALSQKRTAKSKRRLVQCGKRKAAISTAAIRIESGSGAHSRISKKKKSQHKGHKSRRTKAVRDQL